MNLPSTRNIIHAIQNGSIEKCEFEDLPIFNLSIPKSLDGVDNSLLNPIDSWSDKEAYNKAARKLASMFIHNFHQYESGDYDFHDFGPQL